jgi:hypothetical protein
MKKGKGQKKPNEFNSSGARIPRNSRRTRNRKLTCCFVNLRQVKGLNGALGAVRSTNTCKENKKPQGTQMGKWYNEERKGAKEAQ